MLSLVQYASTDRPDDDTKGEEGDRENGVVYRGLLRPPMPALPIGVEDGDACYERDTSNGEKNDLRPDLLVRCPCRCRASLGQRPGSIEDGEDRGKHGENNQAATEVGDAKAHLGQANSRLGFLSLLSTASAPFTGSDCSPDPLHFPFLPLLQSSRVFAPP